MKYVVFQDDTAAIFSDMIDHKSMAIKPVKSAGFCIIETGRNQFDDICVKECSCFGNSHTLKLKSDPLYDKEIIKRMFKSIF